ncbi:MAG: hypothetical protein QXY39_03485 [Thermofilaceae archaeon]
MSSLDELVKEVGEIRQALSKSLDDYAKKTAELEAKVKELEGKVKVLDAKLRIYKALIKSLVEPRLARAVHEKKHAVLRERRTVKAEDVRKRIEEIKKRIREKKLATAETPRPAVESHTIPTADKREEIVRKILKGEINVADAVRELKG